MNVILHPDRTLKTVVSVSEATARLPECPISINDDDIFVKNAPPVTDGLLNPRLNESLIWVEAATVQELDARDISLHEKQLQLYMDEIDDAAGRARKRFVSNGWGIDEEYKRAELVARKFATAGYPADAVPAAVQAEVHGATTPKQAADTIISMADDRYTAIDTIRTIRIGGKAAVKAAVTAAEKASASAAAVEQLNAIKPGWNAVN